MSQQAATELRHRKVSDPTQQPPATKEKEETVLLADQAAEKKWKSWRVRFWTTWAMLGAFAGLMYLGQPALLVLVFFVQSLMFKEIVSLGHVLSKENKLPGFRHLQWFWYFTAQFFIYGRLFRQVSPWLFEKGFSVNTFLSFTFYAAGVVGFVFSLKKGHYKYQFGMFAWCHLTLVMVVIQSSFLLYNMFQGLIWFVLPCLLIVNNDVWAYFFGFFWGRTPLIKLSPKKTWEGFIGATATTLVVGFFLARFLSMFPHMTCPKADLSFDRPECPVVYPFAPIAYELPAFLQHVLTLVGLKWTFITISPMQWHGVAMGAFSSIIAPFGGFFASGFKRAFKIKDFGDSIPGHGGVTDRMDCQILMGLFAYVYYNTFVAPVSDAGAVLDIFNRLDVADQLETFAALQQLLVQKGLILTQAVLNQTAGL